jgi:hypothetical protein
VLFPIVATPRHGKERSSRRGRRRGSARGDRLELALDLFLGEPAARDHHASAMGEVRNVGSRVALEQHEVGALSLGDCAHLRG